MRLRRIEERPISDYQVAAAGRDKAAPGAPAPARPRRRIRLRVTPWLLLLAFASIAPVWMFVDGRIHVRAAAHVVGRTYDLGSAGRGKIVETLVEEGAFVKAGTTVARLDDREAVAAHRAAEMKVASDRAVLAKTESDLARQKELLRRGIAAPVDADHAQAAVDVARAALEASEAERDLAAVRVDLTRIVAPRDGFVTWYPMSAGAAVDEDDVLLTLVDDGARWIEAYVDLADVGRIAVGQPAEVELVGYPGKPLAGRVAQILPAVRQKPPYFGEYDRPPKSYQPVKIELEADGELRSKAGFGQRASVKLRVY